MNRLVRRLLLSTVALTVLCGSGTAHATGVTVDEDSDGGYCVEVIVSDPYTRVRACTP